MDTHHRCTLGSEPLCALLPCSRVANHHLGLHLGVVCLCLQRACAPGAWTPVSLPPATTSDWPMAVDLDSSSLHQMTTGPHADPLLPAPHTHPPTRHQSSSFRKPPVLADPDPDIDVDVVARHSLAASTTLRIPAAALAYTRALPSRYRRHPSDSTSPQRKRDQELKVHHPYEYERSSSIDRSKSKHHKTTSRETGTQAPPSASPAASSADQPSRRRRRLQRSSSRNSFPNPARATPADMASTVAQNPGPAPVQPAAPDPRTASSNPSKTRSRTTIPTQSGKWILGKTIGAGSMGKVKLAKKEEGGEQARNFSISPSALVPVAR